MPATRKVIQIAVSECSDPTNPWSRTVIALDDYGGVWALTRVSGIDKPWSDYKWEKLPPLPEVDE